MLKLALFTLLVGCVTQPTDGPIIKLVYTQTGVPSDVAAYTNTGASAWFGQGIAFDANATGIECALDWYDPGQTLPCVLTVRITYAATSSISNEAGITAHRDTTIAYEASGDELIAVTAHEIGHSVWNTSEHLAPGLDGIMASAAHGTTPTAADIAFASAKTNGWVQP